MVNRGNTGFELYFRPNYLSRYIEYVIQYEGIHILLEDTWNKIGFTLGNKTSLIKFKESEILLAIFLEQNALK